MRFRTSKWLVAMGLVGACGSTEPRAPVRMTAAGCVAPTADGCAIPVDDGSFVKAVAPVTDGVAGGISTAVVTYEAGRICMAGTVDPGPAGTGWGAILLASLRGFGPTSVGPFDATARGIEQVRFTVENPPLTGVLPQMVQLASADCTTVDCLRPFDPASAIDEPQTVAVALANFDRPDAEHPNTALDPTLLAIVQFYVAPLPGVKLPYDFCIKGLTFLDRAGHEVAP